MMAAEDRAMIARWLLEEGAIQFAQDRAYMLAAGWASPVYVDCRRLVGRSEIRRVIAMMALEMIRSVGLSPDVVAGAETAGIPFATSLADALDLPLAYVRKRSLGIGRDAQVEGAPVEGRSVILVDDLTTDGSSKLLFARGLRTAGAHISTILTVFHNDLFPGVGGRLAGEGLKLLHLADWNDVLGIEGADGLRPVDRARLLAFRADPVSWSGHHGGRSGQS